MSDYTPTTEDVRTACEKALRAIYPLAYRRETFDRWLKQVKAETRDDALADAGLLARPLPSREEIAETIEVEILDFFDCPGIHPDLPFTVADAVLDLLKGQDA